MDIKVFGSSSSGNCYLIDDGSSQLLLEAGISPKTLLAKGVKFSQISAVLITHEHQDHSRYVKELSRYLLVCASKGTFESIYNPVRRVELKALDKIIIGGFKIVPFEAKHDAKEPLGYFIHSNATGENVLFATDTYYIQNKFSNINYLMVECNYSEKILQDKIVKANIPLERRRRESHFSLENVKEFLKANDLKNCKEIILLHLSDGLSDEAMFKKEVQSLTGIPTKIAKKYGD